MAFRRTGRRSRCRDDLDHIDYKNIELLEPFVADGGKIRSRRRTKTCARQQRAVTRAVKRARQVGLLPYTSEQFRLFRRRR
jgi:small subunit ribosomal protein S18